MKRPSTAVPAAASRPERAVPWRIGYLFETCDIFFGFDCARGKKWEESRSASDATDTR